MRLMPPTIIGEIEIVAVPHLEDRDRIRGVAYDLIRVVEHDSDAEVLHDFELVMGGLT